MLTTYSNVHYSHCIWVPKKWVMPDLFWSSCFQLFFASTLWTSQMIVVSNKNKSTYEITKTIFAGLFPDIEEYEKLSYSTQLNLKGFDEYIRSFYPEFVSLFKLTITAILIRILFRPTPTTNGIDCPVGVSIMGLSIGFYSFAHTAFYVIG